MNILGISAYYHDSAVALIQDGAIVAAAQEERFTRVRHDDGFPHQALVYCLREGGIAPSQVDHVVFYEKPLLKFERLLENYLAFAPRGFRSFREAIPVWLRTKLFLKNLLCKQLALHDDSCDWSQRMLFSEHHLSHAASAFYPSPFEETAILTMDGVGEWTTTSLALGQGSSIDIIKEIHYPHSLGLLYSAFTYYTGFRVNSGEYKLMGLAPYGEPRYSDLIRQHLVDIKPDGSFRLDLSYFDFCTGLTMTSKKFHSLFGGPPRRPESELTQREMNLAASIQEVTEEIVLKLCRSAAAETGMKNLCLAGGVALNCVANGKVLRDGCFEQLWVQPAAGDAGGALGAALLACHRHAGLPRDIGPVARDGMQGAFLGPAYSQPEIEDALRGMGACFRTLGEQEVISATVDALAAGKAVGWFQGRMEFGPRALGARSILGDPRSATMQSILNLKIKYRESFRPFAPSVLREELEEWFDLGCDSPYMLLVADVAERHRLSMTDEQRRLFGIDKLNVPRSDIPAITHVDYSARIQTVHADTNPRYHALLSAFKAGTGCPVLVNTSFNVRGEPIVCSPEDAYRCFMGTELDCLTIGNAFLVKEEQPHVSNTANRTAQFELD